MGEGGKGSLSSRVGGRWVEGTRRRARPLDLLRRGAGGTSGGVLEGVGVSTVGLVLCVLGWVLREVTEHLHVVGGAWRTWLVGHIGGEVRRLIAHWFLLVVRISVTGKLWRHSNASFLPVAN